MEARQFSTPAPGEAPGTLSPTRVPVAEPRGHEAGDDMYNAGDADTQAELRELRRRCANLTAALETNRQIGIAIGIVMATRRITEDQAFALLRHVSQCTHRKLRDVADDIVLTGQTPDIEGPRR